MDLFDDPHAIEVYLPADLKAKLDQRASVTERSSARLVHEAVEDYFADLEKKRYVKSAAYHEAGHIVVAAVQGLKLRKRGLRIDQKGAGIAYYESKQPDGSTSVGEDPLRVAAIISAYAGRFAQIRFFRPEPCPTSPSCRDMDQARELVGEMWTEHNTRCAKDVEFRERSKIYVDQHWQVIEALAEALLARPWAFQRNVERRWSHQYQEKYMEGGEVASFLSGFEIPATLDEAPAA